MNIFLTSGEKHSSVSSAVRRVAVLILAIGILLATIFFTAWQAEAAIADAITDLKVSGIGYDQITLGWTTPDNEGSVITEYEIQQNSGTWDAISGSDATTVDHTVTGLTPGTSDTFKVRATNSDGAAPESNTATVIPNKFADIIPDGLTLADSDNFGISAALSSDGATLAVGAWGDDGDGTDKGAVHLFTKTGSIWTHSVKIDNDFIGLALADNDYFGISAALSSDGTTLAVGTHGDDTGGTDKGAVHLFTKSGDTWTYSTKIADGTNGLNLANSDYFGYSAALSSDGATLTVGAQGDDTGGTDKGAVHLFTKNGGIWTHSVTIDNDFTGLNLANSDYFGSSAAFSSDGTTLAVGAWGDTTDGIAGGAVHLFTKNGTQWTYHSKIAHGSNGLTLAYDDNFGISTALSEDGTLLTVGASNDDTSGANTNRGAVHLFTKNGTQWTYHSKIAHGSNGLTLANSDHFGISAALSSDGTLAVGAQGDDTGGTGESNRGAAYLFNLTDTIAPYITTQTFTNNTPANGNDPKTGDSLTFSFTFSETLPTAPTVTIGGAPATFIKNGDTYTATYTVTVATPEGSIVYDIDTLTDSAGQSFDPPETNSPFTIDTTAPTLAAIADGTAGGDSHIGMTPDTTPEFSFTSDEAGTIAYTGSCTSSETTAVSGTNTVSFSTLAYAAYTDCAVTVTDEAGNSSSSLAVPDFTIRQMPEAINDLVVSGIGYDQITLGWTTPDNEGSVITEYEIQQNSGTWDAISGSDATTVDHTVTGLTPGTSDTFKVRATNSDGAAPESNTATVIPNKFADIIPDGLTLADSDNFGISAALSSDGATLAVGAWGDDGDGTDKGAVHLFTKTGSIWTHSVKIDNDFIGLALADNDYFGISAALSSDGTTLAVGTHGDDTGGTDKGAVHLFTKSGDTWTYSTKIADGTNGLNLANSDYFGYSAALSSDGATLTVGAQGDDTGGTDKGAVHLFTKNGGIWTHSVTIDNDFTGLNLANSDYFGSSAAFSSDGTTLAVGAWGDTTDGIAGGAVHLFTKNGTQWTYHSKIAHGSNGLTLAYDDNFGISTALSEDGTLLTVGASNDDTSGANTNRGAVHLFTKNGTQWTYHSKIAHGSNGLTLANSDHFGISAALSSDGTLAVGAQGDDTGGTGESNRGAAYLFNLTDTIAPYITTQTFTNNTPANGNDPKTGDSLTFSFTFSETLPTAPTVTIGGAPATFIKNGDTYTATYTVTVATPEGSIVYDIDTLTDSAGQSFDPPETNSPFTIDTTAPTLAAIADGTAGGDSHIGMTPDTTPEFSFTSDEAGTIAYTGSCTSSETTAVSGTNTVSFNALTPATYTDCAVTVTDGAGNSSSSLAVPDFTVQMQPVPEAINDLVVSGIGYDQITLGWATPDNGGSVITEYEIQQNSGTWAAISGSDATTVDHTVTGLTPGTSYTFKVRATNSDGAAPDSNIVTVMPNKFVNNIPDGLTLTSGDEFGTSANLSSDGTTLAVGVPYEDTNGDSRGAVHLFTKTGSIWTHSMKIDSSFNGLTLADDDRFGFSVALSSNGTTLVVGASYDSTGGTDTKKGAVHLFTKSNGVWTYSTKIADGTDGLTLDNGDNFGTSVALSSDGATLAVGAEGDDTGGTGGTMRGAMHIFIKNGNTWTHSVKIDSSFTGLTLANYNYFGSSAAFSSDGTTLAVGAWGDNTDGITGGAVHLFTKTGATWTHSVKIDSSFTGLTLTDDNYFGSSAAFSSDNTLAVGAWGDNIDKGAVYLFTIHGTQWAYHSKIADGSNGLTLTNNDGFGTSATFSSDGTFAAGAWGDDTGANMRGTVYLFNFTDTIAPYIVTQTFTNSNQTNGNDPKTGDSLTFSFTFSETLPTAPTVTIGGGAPATFTKNGNTYTATYQVTDATPEGPITYDIDTLTDSAGQFFDPPETNSPFIVDRIAPTLAVIADGTSGGDSYIGTTADRTPEFSFTSDEAGTIAYAGSCTSSETIAVSGTNTVSFSTLAYAAYTDCAVTVTDGAGNISSSLAVPSFTIDASASPIAITGPDAAYATGQTILATSSVTDANEDWEYQLIDENTNCNSSTAGTFITYTANTALTYGTDASPDVTTDADDGKKVCFKLTDTKGTAGNTSDDDIFYLASDILRLDNAAPTITAITDGTSGGDTTIGGTSDTTPDLSFTLNGLRSGETATLLWTGDCTAENNTITSQTDAATDETITVTLNSAEDGDFTEGDTITGCQVQVRDQAGNVSASLTIPSFTIVFPAPVFANTVNTVTYRKGVAIATLTLPGLRPDTGHGTITFTLSGLPTGTGLTFTAPTTATGTGSLTGTPNQADADASPFTLTYTATESAPSSRVVTQTFVVTVTDFSVTVADDTNGSTPEREKELTVTVTDTNSVTNTLWGMVNNATDCAASSNAQLITAYTPSTTGTTVTITDDSANGQVACFRATYLSNDYYGWSGAIHGIDRTDPVVSTVALTGVLTDAYLSSAETTDTNTIVDTVSHGETGTPTIRYAVVFGSTTCNASVTYSATAPNATNVSGSDGSYKVCVSVTDAAGNIGYGSSDPFVKDTTAPTVSSVPLTGVLGDAYLSSVETTDTNAIVGTVSHSETGTPTIRYAVVFGSTTCSASVTYSATVPNATDVSGSDGSYKVCVSVTDTATNVGYGESQTFTKDTTAPTVSSVPLTGVLGDTYLSSAETSDTNAIVSTPTVSETSTYTTAYAVVFGSTTCNASVTYSATAPNATDVPGSDGSYKVCVSVTDAAGNVGYGSSDPFVKDTTAPTVSSVPLTGVLTDAYLSSAETTNTNAIVSTPTVSETSTYTTAYAVVFGSTTCNASVTYSATAPNATNVSGSDGSYKVCVSVTDAAGNIGYGSSDPFVKDTTAPTVSSVPLTGVLGDTYLSSAETADTNAIVSTPTVSETNTYTTAYAVVSGSTTCSASVTYSATAPNATDVPGSDGSYKVCVSVTDAAGNVGYGESATFTKDTTPPVITLTGDNPLTLEVGDTYTDPGATADTGETVTPTGTVNTDIAGDYTITYTATDAAGNEATKERTVTVNPTAPKAVSNLTATATPNTVMLSWVTPGDGGATITKYQMKQGTGTYTDIAGSDDETTTHTVTGLTEQTAYTFRIRAVNSVGTGEEATAVTITTTDGSAPYLTETPTLATSNTDSAYAKEGDTLTLTFTTSEALSQTPTVQIAGQTVTLPTVTANTYTATYTVTAGTPDGAVTYNIGELTDTAGNTADPPLVTSSITLDSTAPTVSSVPLTGVLGDTYLSSAETSDTNAIVSTPTVSETSTYTTAYAVVFGSTTCNASVTYSATAPNATNVSGSDGSYKVCVSVTDAAGNIGYGSSDPFVKDTTAPTVSSVPLTGVLGDTYLSSAETADTNAIVSTPTVSETNTYTTAYAVVSGSTTCSASVTYSATAPNATDVPGSDGSYKVCVSVTDAAGNVGYGESATFTKDTTPPVITLTGDNPLTLEVGDTYTDPGATADTGETVTPTGTVNTDIAGDYTITYTATDAAGNEATKERTVTVNPTAPKAVSNLTATATPNTVMLSWVTPGDGGATITKYQMKQGTGTYTDIAGSDDETTTHTVTGLTEQTAYTFRIRAVNSVGTGEEATAVTITTTDGSAPYLTETPTLATSNTDSAYAKEGDTLTLTFTTSEALSQTPTVQIAGQTVTLPTVTANTYTATYTVTAGTPDGAVTYNIGELTDTAGNTADPPLVTSSITLDSTAPTVSSVPLTGVLGDTYLSSAETSDTNAIVSTPTVSETSTYTTAYAVVFGSTTCNASVTYSATAPNATNVSGSDGSYKVCVSVTDAAGNIGYGSSDPFVKDTTAPTVSSVPLTGVLGDTYLSSAETADTNAIVSTPTVSETNTYTTAYAVVSGSTTCSASVTYSATAPNATDVPGSDGSYKVCVSVTDAAGNVGYGESATFTKDTTPPVITLTGDNPLTLEVGDTYTDPGATADTGETVTPTGTVNTDIAGDYTITYTATDAAGNEATKERTVTVNPTAPKAVSNLTATATPNTVMLSWVTPGDGGATITKYQMKQGTGTYTDIAGSDDETTTHTVTGLTEQTAYTFNIRAVNSVGTGEEATAVTITTTDGSAPYLTETPTLATSNTDSAYAKEGDTLTLTFTTSEALSQTPTVQIAGQTVTLPTVTANTYTATYTVTVGTPEGAVTYNIGELTDTAGNTADPPLVTSSITLDSTAPTVSSVPLTGVLGDTYLSSAETSDTNAIVSTPTVSETSTYTTAYAVVFGSTTCNASVTYSATAPNATNVSGSDGSYKVCVSVTDAAGNIGYGSSDPFVKDTTAPTVSSVPLTGVLTDAYLSSAETSDTNAIVSTVSHGETGTPTIRYAVVFGSTTCSASVTYSATAPNATDVPGSDGSYKVCVSVTDAAGNVGYGESATFIKDTTAPTVSSVPLTGVLGDTYLSSAETTNTNAIVSTPTVSETNTYTTAYAVVSGSTTCNASVTYSATVPNATDVPDSGGTYKICVKATDAAGNIGYGESQTFTKDTVPPTPQAMDLAATDDTSRVGFTGGDADNSTSATVWTLSGLYKNNTASEWDLDSDGNDDTNGGAAGGVGSVEIRVQRLNTDSSTVLEEEVVTITTTQAQGAIVQPAGDLAKGDYTFTTDVAVTSVFTGTDGNYRIDVRALSTGGEPGSYSQPLTVTLDTTPPVQDGIGAADGHLKIETVRYNDGSTVSHPRHYFYLTDPSNGEPNAVVSIEHTDTDGSHVQAKTIDIDGKTSFVSADNAYTLSDDFTTYTVAYIDAAGNTTGKQPLPDALKPPLITSYDIGSDTYIVVASARNDAGLQTPYKKFTADPDIYCYPKKSGLVKTDYTPGSQIDLLSGDKTCIEVTDGNGHTSVILARVESQPLIANFALHEDGNDPDRSPTDFITNNTTLRLQGTTLPGSTARLEIKESSQSWGDPSDPNDVFAGVTIDVPTDAVDADTGTFEVTYEIPAGYHGGTYTFEVREYVTNIETLGATEIGPITLHDIMYDAEAPAKPPQTPYLDVNDDTGVSGDGITATTQDLTIQVVGEEAAEMTLSTGQKEINTELSGSNTIDIPRLAEGTHTITVTATDRAGNTSPASDPFTLTIDPTAPEVTIVRLNDEDTTIDSDTRFITVANDDTAVEFRVAAIAESACDTASWAASSQDYTSPEQFDPNTAFSAVTNGACFIARDAAYNVATKHSDDAIEGVGNVQITGAMADGTTFYVKSGQVEFTGVSTSSAKVLIKITADEPATFTATQLQDVDFADYSFDMSTTATAFAKTITIPSDADGKKLVAWIWTDKSDHTTATPAIALATLVTDDTPATVTAITVRTNNASGTTAKQNDRLFLDITVNEIVQSATVTLAGITATEADCAVPSAADTQFTCSVTLSNEASEGAVRAEWTLTDRAGNETTGTLTSEIIIDATAPAVTVTSSRGMLISANDVLTLNLGVTDTNGITAGTYAFSATGGTLATCEITATAGQKSVATSCTLTVTVTGDGAPVTLTVPRLTDTPGNVKSAHTTTVARIDLSAPTLSAITGQDSTKNKKFSFTIEAVHNQHTDNRDIPETLTPLFGGDCRDFETDVNFTATIPDSTTQTYAATIATSKRTYETCTVTLRDEAGNESDTLTFTEFTVKGGISIGRVGDIPFKKIQSFFSGASRDTTPVFNPTPPSAQQQTPPERFTPSVNPTPSSAQQQTPPERFAPSVRRQGTVTVAPPARIAATYILGDTHEHIRASQILLNKTFCPIAASGPGSPGRETAYFGPLTQRAVTCLQRAQGRPEDGTLTPQLYSTLLSTVHATVPDRITATCTLGETHKHVRAAQILLNQTPCPVAVSGPGSPGRETVYFGPLTQRAITCFQRAQGRSEDGSLTPQFYTDLHNMVYPAAARQQTPTPEQKTPIRAPQPAPVPVQPIAETPRVTVPDRIAGTYILGDTHEHLKATQILLNQTSCPVAASGPGSPGRETTYFGSLTQRAITCFQRAQGRSEDGTLTPQLYSVLRSAVYPAAAEQTPVDDDQQEDRQPEETPEGLPLRTAALSTG